VAGDPPPEEEKSFHGAEMQQNIQSMETDQEVETELEVMIENSVETEVTEVTILHAEILMVPLIEVPGTWIHLLDAQS
jgi:hypothetical protein